MSLKIFGFRGHEVGTVQRDDLLAAANIVPQRYARLLDSALHARNDRRYAAIVVSDLPGCLQHARQFDVVRVLHLESRYIAGIELDHLNILLTDQAYRGRRFGDRRGAAGRIAVASGDQQCRA